MPIRDFAELTAQPRPSAEFEPYPTILVLATAGDRQRDWVRAGQALQRGAADGDLEGPGDDADQSTG
ncbi:hypothetical protein Ari01nite_92460 [Paractinoplanes rishiriensis]|uniref:Uncharacterized protein n=1 Tax=Paractinoplanes rishiriensis TaxID=1050105 RepID=A0A919MVU3_9ACTN|nr:hypothetical protein Ari01nite_92460 [Actinoplanes rishiriensis]